MGWEKIIGPCILALLLTNALMASDPVPERWLSVHTSAARVTNSARVTARVHAFSHGIPELARSSPFQARGQVSNIKKRLTGMADVRYTASYG